MTTTNTAAAKAQAMIKAKTTRQLIDTFVLTGAVNDPHIYMVRGWIMDELESRNKEAFEEWLESDEYFPSDETLYKYFAC